jgi:hypothetical protein
MQTPAEIVFSNDLLRRHILYFVILEKRRLLMRRTLRVFALNYNMLHATRGIRHDM